MTDQSEKHGRFGRDLDGSRFLKLGQKSEKLGKNCDVRAMVDSWNRHSEIMGEKKNKKEKRGRKRKWLYHTPWIEMLGWMPPKLYIHIFSTFLCHASYALLAK